MWLIVRLMQSTADHLGASPYPTWHAMVKTLVVPQCGLPKVLAVLMYLELVPCGAVHYVQDISIACGMGLPTGLIPAALICPLSRLGVNVLSYYLHLS